MLAHLRFPDEKSRLRRYPEPAKQDPDRPPFQRDRDRVVHSRAFRRLAGKTQVATLPGSSHLRTRLTHTIEVSQVARTVAGMLGLNVDLVEVLALAHDLGHPAFGHEGEAALDAQMRRFGGRFDHNSHALRIVEHFEQRYAAFRGLNLTFEVREGLLKHSRELDPARALHQEYWPHLRPPLEAQLIDPADEIAYLSADLEDAVHGGFLAVDAICDAVPAFRSIHDGLRREYPDVSAERILNDSQRRLFGLLARGLIDGTAERARASGARDCEDVRDRPERLVGCTGEVAAIIKGIRRMLFDGYYYPSARISHERGYCAKLTELFQFYVDRPDRLPPEYAVEALREPVHQVVCDYVAGMTDEFLLRTHRQVLGAAADGRARC